MSTARTANVTPISEAPAPHEQIESIAIGDLRIAPWNARKTITPGSLDELVSSVEAHRIQVPLLVRERSKEAGGFEIVCGHRRFAAAQRIGMNYVPCIVRELTDDEAREIGLVDNLQREDVPALEEADAYAELQQRLGTAAAIAARVGKDVSYVTRRLVLVSLAQLPRKALAERLITVDHALLLARLGEQEQLVNLKWCLSPGAGLKEKVEDVLASRIKDRDNDGRYGYYEAQSVLSLKNHIEEHVGRKLSRAPWDLDDAVLFPDAGACDACPSNTKANDSLFGDLAIDEATCENGLCFERKRDVFVAIRLAVAVKQSEPEAAIRLSWKTTTVKPRPARGDFDADGFSSLQVFKYGQWIDAKKGSCEHIRLGVIVDWSDGGDRGYMGSNKKLRKPGEILSVCIAESCKVHRKGYTAAKSEGGNGLRNENSAEAKAAREKRAAAAKIENGIRIAAVREAIDGVQKIGGELLRRIVLRSFDPWMGAEDEGRFPGLEKALRSRPADSADFARAAVCILFTGDDAYELWADEGSEKIDRGRKELIALLKLLGHDASKAWDKLAAPEGKQGASSPGAPTSGAATKRAAKPAKKSILPAAAKKRIAVAQRKRWAAAKVKKGGR